MNPETEVKLLRKALRWALSEGRRIELPIENIEHLRAVQEPVT